MKFNVIHLLNKIPGINMFKRLILFHIFFVFISFIGLAQKRIVDFGTQSQWLKVGKPQISGNGKYCSYLLSNASTDTMVIESLSRNWIIKIPSVLNTYFSVDNKTAVYANKEDSLFLLKLGTSETWCLGKTKGYKLSTDARWIGYFPSDANNQLILLNLLSREKILHTGVSDCDFVADCPRVVIQKKISDTQVLEVYDLNEHKSLCSWSGTQLQSYIVSIKGAAISILGESRTKKGIWYADQEAREAKLIVNSKHEMLNGYTISSLLQFSKDGRCILFTVLKDESIVVPAKGVNIWSYQDISLQSRQIKNIEIPNAFQSIAVAALDSSNIILLNDENELLSNPTELDSSAMLFRYRSAAALDDNFEWNWNKMMKVDIYLKSLITGSERLIKRDVDRRASQLFSLSGTGRYALYFDPYLKNYITYDVTSGSSYNISHKAKAIWTTEEQYDLPTASYFPIGIAGWTKEDEYVVVYSRRDIYLLDPKGVKQPVNVTNGYGRRNNIIFRFIPVKQDSSIDLSSDIYLNAFNTETKDNGFFKINLSQSKDPTLLTMEPCLFIGPDEGNVPMQQPIKARDTNIYIVRRITESQSLNYVATSDFKTFIPITNNFPEKEYNWLSTELYTWKRQDLKINQGILYKPENFDPTKKYPVIFWYYERRSNSLHNFPDVGASGATLNIPWIVSKGYLVFSPDIHFEVGNPGVGVIKSVTSAAEMLANKPWVDSKRMAIHGHSRGGWATNYLLTHTNMFAAAISASGFSEYISMPFATNFLRPALLGGGNSNFSPWENSNLRIGTNFWDRPDQYINSSPLFTANRVTTPVLMMHNQGDDDVDFHQGLAFFNALRRLGKRVWLLDYDGEKHQINNTEYKIDYSLRMLQFLDHYLKKAPAPVWMTRGVPAVTKGIRVGMELDTEIKTPGEGLLTDLEKKKFQDIGKRKPITVTIK